MSTTPSDKDKQINPQPFVERWSEGEFCVMDLLNRLGGGPDRTHDFTAECSHCHRTLQVHLRAPNNVPEFVKEEARRVAIIAHLRTEH